MISKIWIDADSCPSLVRDYIVNFGFRTNTEIFFVANHAVSAKKDSFKMIICEKEKDAADNYIFTNAEQTDLVITRDIVLAEKLVNKNIQTINDRGTTFTKNNIHNRMEDRNLDLQLAQLGFGGGNNVYGEKQFKKFRSCFENLISKQQ